MPWPHFVMGQAKQHQQIHVPKLQTHNRSNTKTYTFSNGNERQGGFPASEPRGHPGGGLSTNNNGDGCVTQKVFAARPKKKIPWKRTLSRLCLCHLIYVLSWIKFKKKQPPSQTYCSFLPFSFGFVLKSSAVLLVAPSVSSALLSSAFISCCCHIPA